MQSVHGETVTYARDGDSVTVTATPGAMRLDAEIPGLAVTLIDRIDWFIDAADLILSGATVTPEAGDRITRADGTVWRVSSEATDGYVYEFTAEDRSRYRIHTRKHA
jgi:hypothetical protein